MLGQVGRGGAAFTVEYSLAGRMVVFSHGFGVRRDGRGMLAEIAHSLPEGTGYVLFDYNDIDETAGTVRAATFSEQVSRLEAVLAWTKQLAGVETVSLIGHSMGCLVIAELAPEGIDRIILLAPPTTPLGGYRRQRYTRRPDAQRVGDTWHIPRRDGTITIISDAVFDELEQVDAEGELVKLAMFRPFTLVVAEADEVLPDDDYTELIALPAVASYGVEDAGHNFTGTARKELLRIIAGELGAAG